MKWPLRNHWFYHYHQCGPSIESILIFSKRIATYIQGVSYSQKFCGKRGFPNLANGRTSQFMFPKYLIDYQNVKSEIKI